MTKYSWTETPDDYAGYDLSTLFIDEAYVTIENNSTLPNVRVYQLHKECDHCPYQRATYYARSFTTNFQYKYLVAQSTSEYLPDNVTEDVICHLDPNFGEFGVYQITVTNDGCNVTTLSEPVSIYFPIITVLLIYSCITAVIYALYKCYKCSQQNKIDKEEAPTKIRVKSLDTFRGIAIVIMIFANFGCGSYDFCDHAIWNGLHIADLVFPWFMWIMGACVPISIESSFKKKIPKSDLVKNIMKRSVKLFCLGIFLSSGTSLRYLRIFGVLQRFGICYLVTSLICVFLMKHDVVMPEKGFKKHVLDIARLSYGWIVALAILTVHSLVIFLVAEEGCPVGYLGPGGLHHSGKFENCTGGATGFLDRSILQNHTYQYPTIRGVYHTTQPFDPEGILGCLTSIFHVFIGVQAGTILTTYKKDKDRIVRWLIWALVLGLLGGSFCEFSQHGGTIPVNKNLWSISFVLVTSCFAFTLLTICYYIIDVKKKWTGKPFLFAGMNAILMYIGHSMTYNNFPVRWRLEQNKPFHPTHFVALLENIWGTAFWVLVSYYLYKIKYFFTI